MGKYRIGLKEATDIVDKIFEYYELDEQMEDEDDEKDPLSEEGSGEEKEAPAKNKGALELIDPEDEKVSLKEVLELGHKFLVKHARKGRLEVDDKKGFVVVQHLKSPMADGATYLRWHEPTARAELAMSKAKNDQGKILLFMGAIGEKTDAQRLQQLKSIDAALMKELATIFFLVQ